MKDIKKTHVQATNKVDKTKAAQDRQDEKDMNAVSEDVTNALQAVSEFSYDDRKAFAKKFTRIFNDENDAQSAGGEIDTAKYYED